MAASFDVVAGGLRPSTPPWTAASGLRHAGPPPAPWTCCLPCNRRPRMQTPVMSAARDRRRGVIVALLPSVPRGAACSPLPRPLGPWRSFPRTERDAFRGTACAPLPRPLCPLRLCPRAGSHAPCCRGLLLPWPPAPLPCTEAFRRLDCRRCCRFPPWAQRRTKARYRCNCGRCTRIQWSLALRRKMLHQADPTRRPWGPGLATLGPQVLHRRQKWMSAPLSRPGSMALLAPWLDRPPDGEQ